MNHFDVIYETLAVVTLTAHLLSVNVSAAGPLLAAMLDWQSRHPQCEGLRLEARRMAMLSIAMLFVGAATGLALAGIMWLQGDRGLFEILPNFAARIRWALWELAFYLVCLVIYVALFARHVAGDVWARPARTVLAVLAATNLLYHFPPLFAVIARAADAPESISTQIGPNEFRSLMFRPAIVSLTVHVALASLAVAAVVMMYRMTRTDDTAIRLRGVRIGAGVALAATAGQLPVGLWVLLSLPPLTQRHLMGGDLLGTAALALSVMLTFGLLHRLASACLTSVTAAHVRRTLLELALLVLLMTATLRQAGM